MKDYDQGVMEILGAHDWPGNVRELRNMVERLVIMARGDVVGVGDLGALRGPTLPEPSDTAAPGALGPSPPPPPIAPAAAPLGDFDSLALAREDFERRYIAKKHEVCGGNMSRTAEALGVERSYLYKKMKALALISAKKTEA